MLHWFRDLTRPEKQPEQRQTMSDCAPGCHVNLIKQLEFKVTQSNSLNDIKCTETKSQQLLAH